jgi:hypothetical protein
MKDLADRPLVLRRGKSTPDCLAPACGELSELLTFYLDTGAGRAIMKGPWWWSTGPSTRYVVCFLGRQGFANGD